MTSAGTVTTAVEQAYFRRTDGGSVTVVASSLDGEQTALSWTELVGPQLGADASESRHTPAFRYVTFPDGFAAVLRRSGSPFEPGVVDTHALLGLSAQLTPAVALTTASWAGWRDAPPVDPAMARLRADDLDVPDAAAALRTTALSRSDLLARSLAWLLQSPRAPLGLVGCAEEDRIALLWGLHTIAHPLLAGRPWTFSTAGDPDGTGEPASITFLSPGSAGAQAGDRLVVDLRRDQGASPHNEYRANALVYCYEFGVDPPGVDEAPAVLPVPVPAPVRAPAPVLTGRAPAAPVPAGRCDALVRQLVSAPDGHAFDRALRELEFAVVGSDDRDEMRAALERAGWAAAPVERLVPPDRWEDSWDRIVRVAFGASEHGRPPRTPRPTRGGWPPTPTPTCWREGWLAPPTPARWRRP